MREGRGAKKKGELWGQGRREKETRGVRGTRKRWSKTTHLMNVWERRV